MRKISLEDEEQEKFSDLDGNDDEEEMDLDGALRKLKKIDKLLKKGGM